MRKTTRLPDIPVYVHQPDEQPSTSSKQLPPPPEDEPAFFSESQHFDGITPFFRTARLLKGRIEHGSRSSNGPQWNPNLKGENESMRTKWGSDGSSLTLTNEYSRYHPIESPSSAKRNDWEQNLWPPFIRGPSFGTPSHSRRGSEFTGRLARLRRLMRKENGLDFYIVPSADAHDSEHVAASDKRLQFISGFTGPIGQAIITKDSAYLFTGSAYWHQALREIDPLEWTLIRCGSPGTPEDSMEWLAERVAETPLSQIGVDPRMISYEKANLLLTKVNSKDPNSTFLYPQTNLVDMTWSQKPQKSLNPVYIQDEDVKSAAFWKLRRLRQWITAQRPDVPFSDNIQVPAPSQIHVATLIDSLDSIAYLLNLCGSDIPYKRTFHAYLFVSLDKAILFIEPKKLNAKTLEYLDLNGVQQRNYKDVWTFVRNREWGVGKVLLSPQTSYAIALLLTNRYTIAPSFVERMMSTDDEDEATDSLKPLPPQDGVSIGEFMAWLTKELADGHSILGYESVADTLDTNSDGIHRKTIKIHVTKPLVNEQRTNGNTLASLSSKQPSEIPYYFGSELHSRNNSSSLGHVHEYSTNHSHSHSQGTVIISTPIPQSPAPQTPLSEIPKDTKPTATAKTQDTTRHSSSIDALDLANTTRYSQASSRTESTDYGLFYTRRAYSQENIELLNE